MINSTFKRLIIQRKCQGIENFIVTNTMFTPTAYETTIGTKNRKTNQHMKHSVREKHKN